MNIFVLGAGSWGGVLAALLNENGNNVTIWEIDSQKANELDANRKMPFIDAADFPKEIKVTSDLSQISSADAVLFVVPSHFLRGTCEKIKSLGIDISDKLIISATKGIENGTLKRMSEIIEEIFPAAQSIIALSGPSHAEEVCFKMPTAIVSASANEVAAVKVRDLFRNNYFRVYSQTDIIGVETGAALKNVFAIACGIVDGLNFGDNTKAALATRGIKELVKLGKSLGGREETFYGLAGIGDLMVTCFSKHSRNRAVGEIIARGKTLDEAQSSLGMVAEGVKTTASAYNLGKKYNIELPIINAVYDVLFNGLNPVSAVATLMTREAKHE
ncbi:MAG: NAD(P)-dependent glycerol-3-phosphate dehydrogenase [Elusimicrobia bacterium]|nr:NAD(P)-dependent glycerol-3-phosphate dehydrogenase [Elusimicrobiota bacterium]